MGRPTGVQPDAPPAHFRLLAGLPLDAVADHDHRRKDVPLCLLCVGDPFVASRVTFLALTVGSGTQSANQQAESNDDRYGQGHPEGNDFRRAHEGHLSVYGYGVLRERVRWSLAAWWAMGLRDEEQFSTGQTKLGKRANSHKEFALFYAIAAGQGRCAKRCAKSVVLLRTWVSMGSIEWLAALDWSLL